MSVLQECTNELPSNAINARKSTILWVPPRAYGHAQHVVNAAGKIQKIEPTIVQGHSQTEQIPAVLAQHRDHLAPRDLIRVAH